MKDGGWLSQLHRFQTLFSNSSGTGNPDVCCRLRIPAGNYVMACFFNLLKKVLRGIPNSRAASALFPPH